MIGTWMLWAQTAVVAARRDPALAEAHAQITLLGMALQLERMGVQYGPRVPR